MPQFLPPPEECQSPDGTIRLADFFFVSDADLFYYGPTGALWSAGAVDGRLPELKIARENAKAKTRKASWWLKRHRAVEAMTWAPGEPEIISDRILADGGWKEHPGARTLNLYKPPILAHGDAALATPWVEHLYLLFPDEADLIADYFAHRIQFPGCKINYVLLLGGPQGVGKDYLLQPLKLAVGHWNFQEISPTDLLSPYNPFAKAIVLRINEAHDLGESGRFDRYAFYERLKVYAAAPPDVLPTVDKYIRRFYVPNIVSCILTTNHKSGGIHLPDDDRRHLVCWTERTKEEFSKEFWTARWNWLLYEGGASHVAAWLAQRDLSAFNAAAIPHQTAAFYEIVHASLAPEEAELADALDELGERQSDGTVKRRDVCLLEMIRTTKTGAALEWLTDKRSRRAVPLRMEKCGYLAVRHPTNQRGLWRINGKRMMLYARSDLRPDERLEAAKAFELERTKPAGKS